MSLVASVWILVNALSPLTEMHTSRQACVTEAERLRAAGIKAKCKVFLLIDINR